MRALREAIASRTFAETAARLLAGRRAIGAAD
jgi:hypothetical protein